MMCACACGSWRRSPFAARQSGTARAGGREKTQRGSEGPGTGAAASCERLRRGCVRMDLAAQGAESDGALLMFCWYWSSGRVLGCWMLQLCTVLRDGALLLLLAHTTCWEAGTLYLRETPRGRGRHGNKEQLQRLSRGGSGWVVRASAVCCVSRGAAENTRARRGRSGLFFGGSVWWRGREGARPAVQDGSRDAAAK